MKTPIEFDYDLWTTEDGRCMVRVKRTGEVTEVDREIMKILRLEEKKLRRSYVGRHSDDEGADGKGSILSLDMLPEGDPKASAWLVDPYDFTQEVHIRMLEEKFVTQLSEYQKEVYFSCLKNGMTGKEFAEQHGNSQQGVQQTVCLIRKMAKKFFKKI